MTEDDDKAQAEIAKKFCRLIGCSGLSPDLRLDAPLDCSIAVQFIK